MEPKKTVALHALDGGWEKTLNSCDLAMHFATVKHDEFIGVPHQIADNGLCQINDCVAYYECETAYVHTGGDHNIIVAKVLSLKNYPEKEPLIYARSKFVGLDFAELKTN